MLTVMSALGDVQIPLLAAVLLGASSGKIVRIFRQRSLSVLGPTPLSPLHLRRTGSLILCGLELALGLGLILTCGRIGSGPPAELVRLGTGILFVVAALALIELRSARPDIGCGCFGELSNSPITTRTVARSTLLAAVALASTGLPPITLPRSGGQIALMLLLFTAETAAFGVLSPEIREMLVRIGYSAPCELRAVNPEQTLINLRGTAHWRRHAHMVADEEPVDMWRELCWQYIAFASNYTERNALVMFAVYLEPHQPAIMSALVDSATGTPLPWPAESAKPGLAQPAKTHPRVLNRGLVHTPVPAQRVAAARTRNPGGPAPASPGRPIHRRVTRHSAILLASLATILDSSIEVQIDGQRLMNAHATADERGLDRRTDRNQGLGTEPG